MNRKEKKKNVRKIFRQGKTSLAVTLPIEIVNQLKLRERQKVRVTKHRGGISIKFTPLNCGSII